MGAKLQTVNIRVKGSRYYEAELAYECGDLANGTTIDLLPDENNLHDSNAVSVFSCSGKMLGHIPRDLARKYKELILLNRILESKISGFEVTESYNKFEILVSIKYLSSDVSYEPNLPTSAGCYVITLDCQRSYIGATVNLRKRCGEHLRDLLNKNHANNALQSDFSEENIESFKFSVVKETSTLKEAEHMESTEIRERLKKGEILYNKTIDGKGIFSKYDSGLSTVSDFGRAPQYHSNFDNSLSIGKVQETESKNVLDIDKALNEIIEKVKNKEFSETKFQAQEKAFLADNSVDDKDEKEWIDSVIAAALKGDCRAQFSLGLIYTSGSFLERNDKSALKWFRLAAEQGYEKAQFRLGMLLQEDRSHSKDLKEAEKWHRLAAGKGLADAQIQLGLIHRDGIGVPTNYDEALKWFRKAVKQGSAIATFHLGDMHRNGMGIPQNALKAYACYSSAAASGLNVAIEKINYLKNRFSKEDLEKGNAMARNIADASSKDLI